MTRTLNAFRKSLASRRDRYILCCYINVTSQIQVTRIANNSSWQAERVVFPKQRLMFEAMPEDKLEVYTSETVFFLMPCREIQVIGARI